MKKKIHIYDNEKHTFNNKNHKLSTKPEVWIDDKDFPVMYKNLTKEESKTINKRFLTSWKEVTNERVEARIKERAENRKLLNESRKKPILVQFTVQKVSKVNKNKTENAHKYSVFLDSMDTAKMYALTQNQVLSADLSHGGVNITEIDRYTNKPIGDSTYYHRVSPETAAKQAA